MNGRSAMRGLFALCTMVVFSWMFIIVGSLSWAQEYPNRPITIVIATPPGGSSDIPARAAEESLRDTLGVPIILENKPGTGIGASFVASAKPDGYTVLTVSTSAITIVPLTNPAITFRYTDFIPVFSPNVDYIGFSAQPGAPFKTLDELISYARKNPGKLTCATAGMGTTAHLFLEAFNMHYGLNIVAVHFKGGAPATNALLGGHVDLAAPTSGNVMPQIKAGRLNLLAIGAPKRLKDLPDVPTLAEKGLTKVLDVRNAYYISKNCPKITVDKLSLALEKAFSIPKVVQIIENAGIYVDFMKTDEIQKYLEIEYTLAAEVLKKLGPVK